MSSSSIRVSAELFTRAQQAAGAMSRSTAQQIEHWARLGLAIEEAGLTVAAARKLVESGDIGQAVQVPDHNALWKHKRALQERDIQAVQSGRVQADAMSWFSTEQAHGAKLVGSPY
jgi:hypothetical protein